MGHAIRSGVIVEHLLGKNEVSIFAHGRSYDYLSEKFDNVHQIGGFNTVYEANQVNSAKTFFNGIKDYPLIYIKPYLHAGFCQRIPTRYHNIRFRVLYQPSE